MNRRKNKIILYINWRKRKEEWSSEMVIKKTTHKTKNDAFKFQFHMIPHTKEKITKKKYNNKSNNNKRDWIDYIAMCSTLLLCEGQCEKHSKVIFVWISSSIKVQQQYHFINLYRRSMLFIWMKRLDYFTIILFIVVGISFHLIFVWKLFHIVYGMLIDLHSTP